MATRGAPTEASDFSSIANKKLIELKKKIALADARKKAYIGEWTEREKQNADTISELKKDIKNLTSKLTFLNNVDSKKFNKEPQEVVQRISYPPGAKTAQQANDIYELKIIDLTKQFDLLNYKYNQRKLLFDKLAEQYHELLASKTDAQNAACNDIPATVEEDVIRKRVCHLENEIHKINVQWMEAEHIRKKYKSIKASLTSDSDNFEKSLLELEESLKEQQADINRMQEIHNDALQMRDSTKIVLHKQEHTANASTRLRERQALDLRRQVDERKIELERLERKLFSTGTGKQMLHQGSIESESIDHQVEKKDGDLDPTNQVQRTTNELELLFKNLMETTGATTSEEVVDRFISQKESTSRLNYLRTVTEEEKKQLEIARETILSQLDILKFSDVKENEESQEQVEALKNQIEEAITRKNECLQNAEQTTVVIEHIRATIVELIMRLQEIDEGMESPPIIIGHHPTKEMFDAADLNANQSNESLLQILDDKIKRALVISGQVTSDIVAFEDEDLDALAKYDELQVPLSPPLSALSGRPPSTLDDKERPQPYPPCYVSLMVGRNTGQISAASAQIAQPVATDDEGDVPSRSYLKRQAQYIVDAKSRRKGFRAPRR